MTEAEIIKDLSKSLGKFLENHLQSQKMNVTIDYNKPIPKLKENLQMPIINIFCMDISLKEDTKSKEEGDKVNLKITVSYLISPFTEDPLQEQELLGSIIIVLKSIEKLPETDLVGYLSKEKEDVKVKLADIIDFSKKIMLYNTLKAPYHLGQGVQLETQFCCVLPKKETKKPSEPDLGFL